MVSDKCTEPHPGFCPPPPPRSDLTLAQPLPLPPPPPLPPHVPLSGDVPIEYCGEDQAVCAVGIATPRAGVFLEAIQHLIVLCTTSEVWKSIGKVWETCVGCSWKMRAGVVLEA